MVCAQYNNVSMCGGDSGGPLVCNNRLAGITSFVIPGCPPSGHNGFAKVSSAKILNFIKTYMSN
ncbi:AGAP010614-PA-like protein [Anopheles sinensis]|uniref:AGAP010614-PA-like protein n=1 Tax=Anopheles sinensis TaxID=74873 RepID=A0A084W8G8_ANOSI|nr:AGAP010614-PA-like protein [Anopheles sinensis]